MGCYAAAEISFGIKFEEGFEFPWDCFDSIEEWYREVSGFVNPHENPYDENGEYKPGFNDTDTRVDAYVDANFRWDRDHPIPIQLIDYQEIDNPAFIMAVATRRLRCEIGEPSTFIPMSLMPGDQSQVLIGFCEKFGIDMPDEPRWWLSAYYG